MEKVICRKDIGLTMTEDYEMTLVHAVADCEDARTGEIVPLTFYFLRQLSPLAEIKSFITMRIGATVAGLGFRFVNLITVETSIVHFNAERMWKEEHEQKALPY